jgi:hypothetical protein
MCVCYRMLPDQIRMSEWFLGKATCHVLRALATLMHERCMQLGSCLKHSTAMLCVRLFNITWVLLYSEKL